MQKKKPEVRQAILDASFTLFSEKGYVSTTLPQIAARAGVSTTNVYVYFDSKLSILYAIHGPWLERELDRVESEISALTTDRARLRHFFTELFQEMPAKEGGFARNIIQAIATAKAEDHYRPSLIIAMEERLMSMLVSATRGIAPERLRRADMAHFLVMALDGFIAFHNVAPDRGCKPETIDFLCDLFEGLALREA